MPNSDHTPSEPDLDRLAQVFADHDAKVAAIMEAARADRDAGRADADDRDLGR